MVQLIIKDSKLTEHEELICCEGPQLIKDNLNMMKPKLELISLTHYCTWNPTSCNLPHSPAPDCAAQPNGKTLFLIISLVMLGDSVCTTKNSIQMFLIKSVDSQKSNNTYSEHNIAAYGIKLPVDFLKCIFLYFYFCILVTVKCLLFFSQLLFFIVVLTFYNRQKKCRCSNQFTGRLD